jgi:hypothetical protein
MRIVSFSLVALLALASAAHAQDFQAAAKHFADAQAAFGRKHFHVAATEFQAAYDITKDPVLLYNIGEAWQKAGEGKKAVASYKAYLKAQPTAQDRADVQNRVKMITAKKYKIANQSAPGDVPAPQVAAAPAKPKEAATMMPFPSDTKESATTMPFPSDTKPDEKATMAPSFDDKPAPPPATLEPPSLKAPPPARAEAPPGAVEPAPAGLVDEGPVSKMRVAAWVCVAATVAVLTAGAIFSLAAQSRGDEISRRFTFVDASGQPRKFDASAQSDYQNLKDEGQLYDALGIGFFAGAGALAVVTTVLFAVDAHRVAVEKKRSVSIAPSIGPGRAGVAASWSF